MVRAFATILKTVAGCARVAADTAAIAVQELASDLRRGGLFKEIQKYRNTFAIKLLHKAYNQHQGAHPTPAHAQCRTAHRLRVSSPSGAAVFAVAPERTLSSKEVTEVCSESFIKNYGSML